MFEQLKKYYLFFSIAIPHIFYLTKGKGKIKLKTNLSFNLHHFSGSRESHSGDCLIYQRQFRNLSKVIIDFSITTLNHPHYGTYYNKVINLHQWYDVNYS